MPVPKPALGAERPSLSRETPQMASRPLQRHRTKDGHFDKAGAMSALVLMAAKQRTSRQVRKVPRLDSCTAANSIFDHVVGNQQTLAANPTAGAPMTVLTADSRVICHLKRCAMRLRDYCRPVQWRGEGVSGGVGSGRGGRGGWSAGDAVTAAEGCDETDAAAGCLGVSGWTSLGTFFRGGT
jgi:hypothetical protein